MSTKIPKKTLWRMRYRAYRHKYGKLGALWRGVVYYAVYDLLDNAAKGVLARMMDDENELIQYLVTAELGSITLHTVGPDGEDVATALRIEPGSEVTLEFEREVNDDD